MGAKVYSEKVANGYILIISFVLQFTHSTVFYMYALEIGSMLPTRFKIQYLLGELIL